MSDDQVYERVLETRQALDRDVELRSMTPKQKQKLIEAIEEKKRNAYDKGSIAEYWAYADCIELIEEILP